MLRLAVPIPVDATATQLGAGAALAAQLGQGRWEDLSRSFAQLDQRQASVPEPMPNCSANWPPGCVEPPTTASSGPQHEQAGELPGLRCAAVTAGHRAAPAVLQAGLSPGCRAGAAPHRDSVGHLGDLRVQPSLDGRPQAGPRPRRGGDRAAYRASGGPARWQPGGGCVDLAARLVTGPTAAGVSRGPAAVCSTRLTG